MSNLTMRSLKKWSIVFLAVIMSVFVLAGCGNSSDKAATANGGKKTIVVTTGFLNDIVHQLSGNDFNVEQIIPNGDDPHLYVAKPQDLAKIKKADLVMYHGLHFEGKMADALKGGFEVAHNFPKDQIGQMEEDGKMITDPHFWFNITLYKQAVKNVSEQLIKLDPSKKAQIEKNTTAYLKKLDELKDYATKKIADIPKESRFLVTPHDAFNYFSRQYDIPVTAPQGVSTEGEVSNADIEKTANYIVEHHIKAIFAESTTDPARMKKLQEVVASKGWHVKVVHGEGQELLADSLANKGKKGDNYIDMVKHDVDLMNANLK